MSEIADILVKLKGTEEAEILLKMEESYQKIAEMQKKWYDDTKFLCPEGCGTCCHNFEPDLLDAEALYMAAWLLENQTETAEKVAEGIFPFENGEKTCLFHNFDDPYHCSIYGGRACICRLFGASCFFGKEGKPVWKPCKFYPQEMLSKHNPPLEHKQYNAQETEKALGALPPPMSDCMEQVVGICPDNHETKLIRDILPDTVRKLKWIISLNQE